MPAKNLYRTALTMLFTFLIILSFEVKAQKTNDVSANQPNIFAKGEKAPGENFTGNVWLNIFVPADTIFNCQIANVTFEAGARTKWHIHPGGQILLVTEGIGYYQEKGKSKQILRKGDVVQCLPGVEHWHGASPETAMTHIGMSTGFSKGSVLWLQKVTEEEYNSQK